MKPKFLLIAITLVAMNSCIDPQYDLVDSNLNKNLSLFNNGMSLPVGNVQKITLSNFIDTKNNDGIIKEDEQTNAYYISKEGNADQIKIEIGETNIKNNGTTLDQVFSQENFFYDLFNNPLFTDTELRLPINTDNYQSPIKELIEQIIKTNNITDKYTLLLDDSGIYNTSFNIDIDDVPEEINKINHLNFNKFNLKISLSVENLNAFSEKIILDDNFRIYIPNFIVIDPNNDLNIQTDSNKDLRYLDLSGTEIAADRQYIFEVPTIGADFGESGIPITVDENTGKRKISYSENFTIEGNAYVNHIYKNTDNKISVPFMFKVSNINTKATSVKGQFDIKVDPVNEVVNLNKEDLPDFMSGDNARINAKHASIKLTVNSKNGKLPADINLDAKISAYRKNIVTEEITTKLKLNADKPNEINGERYIYRYLISDTGELSEGFTSIKINELSKLIDYIPDSIILFSNIIVGDGPDKQMDIDISKTTELDIDYSFNTPLEFGNELNLSYSDTIKDFHSSLKDIETKGVEISGDVEFEIPVNLKLSAEAIDIDGNKLDRVNISITPENKIQKGKQNFSIKITTENPELISERFDGIVLKIDLGNENESAQIKSTDFILLNNLKLSVLGGITINSDNF